MTELVVVVSLLFILFAGKQPVAGGLRMPHL